MERILNKEDYTHVWMPNDIQKKSLADLLLPSGIEVNLPGGALSVESYSPIANG